MKTKPDAGIMTWQLLREKVEERIRRDIPEWHDRQLEIIKVDFNSSSGNLPMSLWMSREIPLYGTTLLSEKAHKTQDAFNLVGAFKDWNIEVRGSRHLDARFLKKDLDGAVSQHSRHVSFEMDCLGNEACTLLLTAPDGARLAFLRDAVVNNIAQHAQYYAYARGEGAVFPTFLLEQQRVVNALIDCSPPKTDPNFELSVMNTHMILTLGDEINWDEIVLAPNVATTLRDDFFAFLKGEFWYRRNRIPYKRGYLLCGPPGNGKTCVARAMARTPGFHAYTFDFAAKRNNENENLMELFGIAADTAPSIILLEDLDRVFADKGKTEVTLDCLFNCIDGVAGTDGVVVVATANHPEWLDSAIRNRPGRFDRVVTFPLPTQTERRSYLDLLFGNCADSLVSAVTLERIAVESDSFAMAHLKELFVSSGNSCVIAGKEKIEDADALEAFAKIRAQFAQTRESKAGFGDHRQAAGF